jgi:hypothetical protein
MCTRGWWVRRSVGVGVVHAEEVLLVELKYKLVVVAVVILAVIVVGDGYLRTRRADQKASGLKSAVSAMSIQQLARASEECDSAQSPGAPAKYDAGYCEEVFRAIEAQPLQLVQPPPPK